MSAELAMKAIFAPYFSTNLPMSGPGKPCMRMNTVNPMPIMVRSMPTAGSSAITGMVICAAASPKLPSSAYSTAVTTTTFQP